MEHQIGNAPALPVKVSQTQLEKHNAFGLPATEVEIGLIVGEVELSKQINPPLSQHQRTQLILDLANRGFTFAELRKRAESVKIRKTFGTIGIEYWVDDIVILQIDAVRMANDIAYKIIEKRKREFIALKGGNPSHHELAQEGLMDMVQYGRILLEQRREKIRQTLELRAKDVRRIIIRADEKTKEELYQKLITKTGEAFDKLYPQWLHIRAAELLEEVEELKLRM